MDCNPALDFIPDLDDWTQRLKETPYDPLEDIRQEHETWLAELEGLAVEALASGDWNNFYQHLIEFQSKHDLHGVTGIAIAKRCCASQIGEDE